MRLVEASGFWWEFAGTLLVNLLIMGSICVLLNLQRVGRIPLGYLVTAFLVRPMNASTSRAERRMMGIAEAIAVIAATAGLESRSARIQRGKATKPPVPHEDHDALVGEPFSVDAPFERANADVGRRTPQP